MAAQRGALVINRIFRNLLLLILAINIPVILAVDLFTAWKWGGEVQTNLESQYIPTAQYLMANPEPTPQFLTIDPPHASVNPTIGVCIIVDSRRLEASFEDVAEWTRIYINNQRRTRNDYGVSDLGSFLENDSHIPGFCFLANLDAGFHLIEIRVGASISALLNPNSALTYTWAYQVE